MRYYILFYGEFKMMNFDAIINNPSIMGVLGVILGAMIGGIINCVINKQNHGFQKERDRIEKSRGDSNRFLVTYAENFNL